MRTHGVAGVRLRHAGIVGGRGCLHVRVRVGGSCMLPGRSAAAARGRSGGRVVGGREGALRRVSIRSHCHPRPSRRRQVADHRGACGGRGGARIVRMAVLLVRAAPWLRRVQSSIEGPPPHRCSLRVVQLLHMCLCRVVVVLLLLCRELRVRELALLHKGTLLRLLLRLHVCLRLRLGLCLHELD